MLKIIIMFMIITPSGIPLGLLYDYFTNASHEATA